MVCGGRVICGHGGDCDGGPATSAFLSLDHVYFRNFSTEEVCYEESWRLDIYSCRICRFAELDSSGPTRNLFVFAVFSNERATQGRGIILRNIFEFRCAACSKSAVGH